MGEAAAFEADRRGDVVQALELYERAASEGASADLLVTMAVLYWQVADAGFWVVRDLPLDLVRRASLRVDQVLELAERRFPGAAEVEFWKRYFAWTDRGEPFAVDDCRRLLRQNPGYLEPVMHLLVATAGREGRDLVPALVDQARQRGTHRARYVASVVASVVKQSA